MARSSPLKPLRGVANQERVPGGHYRAAVVIAEDEEAERFLAQEALEQAGYLVLGARDGTEALARMLGLAMRTVAVVDLRMPRMSGEELIAAMKANEKLRHIPIIVVTGQSARDLRVTGADRVLSKPVTAAQLLRELEALLGAD